MCDADLPPVPRLSRRSFLAAVPAVAVAGSVVGGVARAPRASAVTPNLLIVPRAEWGPTLAPTGPVPDELDVRFLLVHHSVNANTYAADAVPGMLTGIFRFHTGEKGWPDIAYNFFVDRFGGVWEGRLGSLAGPKAVDATGGSQGFAQLCCFLGDHSTEPPSDLALVAMGRLLGWLADRHDVDLADGARAQFTSRGSNRHPAGAPVDVATIAGHRDVSRTACPGDAAYRWVVDGTFRRVANSGYAPPAATSSTSTAVAAPPSTTTTTVASTTTSPSSTVAAPGPTSTSSPASTAAAATVPATSSGGSSIGPALAAAGALAAAAAGLVALRARRTD